MVNPHVFESKTDEDCTLSGKTTTAMREAIISGKLVAGQKLNEPKLAKQFKVSRGPLRESIRRLVAMQLVTHKPHQGATVVTLEYDSIMELYDIREALEGKAAALAAENMTLTEIEQIKKLLVLHHQHHDHNDGHYMQQEGDYDFHYQIIKGSKNKMLIRQLCDELYHLIRLFRSQTSRFKSRSRHALIEHEQLLYAIEQRNPQLAEQVMRHHISRARQSVHCYLTEQKKAI